MRCGNLKSENEFLLTVQCNPDIRDPGIRDILSGPKLEAVLMYINETKPGYKI